MNQTILMEKHRAAEAIRKNYPVCADDEGVYASARYLMADRPSSSASAWGGHE